MRLLNRECYVNGTCIDDLIENYTTLGVTGRESVPIDLETVEVASRHGEVFRSRRFESKKLTVFYCIQRATLQNMQSVYDRLKQVLQDTEAKFVFGDELDKYWIGTPELEEPKYKGMDAAHGKFTVYLSDPHKYSVEEREVDFTNGVAVVYYNGTVEGRPVFEATFPDTNGFVSFTKGDRSLVFGNPNDEGGEQEEQEEPEVDPDALIEYTFDSMPSGNEWSQNTGVLPYVVSATVIAGATAVNDGYIYGNTFGSGDKWHGPTISRLLAGSKTTCELSFYHCVEVTANSQEGMQQISLTSANGNVAAISFWKNTTSDKKGGYDLYVNGSRKKSVSYSMAAGNAISGTGGGRSSIKKEGAVITFNVGGTIYQYTDTALTDVAVTYFTFYFARWKSATMLNKNRLFSFRFVSPDEGGGGGGEPVIIEHAFHSGDVMTADANSADITLNGIVNYGLGDITNPWEEFTLEHGENIITVDSSDWAESEPSVKMRFREVYR